MITAPEIAQISVAEHIQIVEDVWDTIAADSESLPISEELGQELDRRVELYRQNPNVESSWAEVKQRIMAQK